MALVAMAIPLCPGAGQAGAVVSDCCWWTVNLRADDLVPSPWMTAPCCYQPRPASGAIGCAGWSPPPTPLWVGRRGGRTRTSCRTS